MLAKIAADMAVLQHALAAGDMATVEKNSQLIIEKYPATPQARFELAMFWYNQLGNYKLAIQLLEDALKLDPDHVPCLMHLGVIYIRVVRDGAPECFERVLELEPRNTDAMVKLAKTYMVKSDFANAESLLLTAAKADPSNCEIYLFLGDIYKADNRIEDAQATYRKVLTLEPRSGIAHRILSTISPHEAVDDDILAMEALYQNSFASMEDRRMAALGLGKAYDDLHDFDKSFHFYSEGNRLLRASLNTGPPDYRANVESICRIFSSTYVDKLKQHASDTEGPVFILGMPRSGTSLVEQIVASHSLVHGAGEFFALGVLLESAGPLSYPEIVDSLSCEDNAALLQNYWQKLKALAPSGEPFVTDKTPHYFQYIGLIAALLPNAKIIHCTRDPRATCVSIFMQGFPEGHYYASDLKELGEYYRCYQDIMRHWHELFPGQILDVNYEELVADKDVYVRKILDHCNLDVEEECLSFHKSKRSVQTPSFLQVRQPVYTKALKGWQRYEQHLQPLFEGLGESLST
ncbi:hypothetical protein BST96_19785 [Oceanicoccus sagamiensis]|uniref:Uncharacterized protein n=1 Tax=Oceanicoccus sagamiensis TaxID=716816 RepID=A0A1X9NG38_9GAMM|nr:hypothetical protein BST96_19785 [Oceanicoccus sagamiensis]